MASFRAIIGTMNLRSTNPDVLTCARMAAGMTSRARRPETSSPAG